jgi:hypothetical protein
MLITYNKALPLLIISITVFTPPFHHPLPSLSLPPSSSNYGHKVGAGTRNHHDHPCNQYYKRWLLLGK